MLIHFKALSLYYVNKLHIPHIVFSERTLSMIHVHEAKRKCYLHVYTCIFDASENTLIEMSLLEMLQTSPIHKHIHNDHRHVANI